MSSKIMIQNKGTKKVGNVESLVKWFVGKFGYMKAKKMLARQYQIIIYLEVF